MEQRELVEVLAKLHAELSKTDQVDPATLESLRALTGDMNRLLDQQGARAAQSADVEPVTRGLKDWLLEFEAQHPQLSDTVGKMADALAAMGI
jgi:Domain of unknown function (DUF4404)